MILVYEDKTFSKSVTLKCFLFSKSAMAISNFFIYCLSKFLYLQNSISEISLLCTTLFLIFLISSRLFLVKSIFLLLKSLSHNDIFSPLFNILIILFEVSRFFKANFASLITSFASSIDCSLNK